ncbi:hypothetical protein GALL_108230 [mine drainage metagenome]|uniref:Cytochrome c domain-containing protein n=1 Tax=mine drainage metagenome TaxID=410659 RepID=A0A1J5SSC7_9ZZZZ
MNKLLIYIGVLGGIILFSSCYNNKKDITTPTAKTLSNISFRDDIVPIVISGACGCHNNGLSQNAVQFTHYDTIFYSTILARAGVFNDMASGKQHPGEGSIYFTPAQAAIIKAWFAQGAKDNYVPPAITGPVTYTTNIVPLYKTVCKGSACHGGLGPTLDYAKMSADKDQISTMMASAGANGHKGGALSLDGTTTATFLAWIAQGLPQ